MTVRLRPIVCLACMASVLGACAGELDDPQRFSVAVRKYTGAAGSTSTEAAAITSASEQDAGTGAPPACVLQIFKTTCGLAGCHAEGSPQIDLVSDGVASRLIDQTSNSATCMGRTYISSDGSSSLLLDKLTDSPPCGSRMPLTGMLDVASQECFADWVYGLSSAGASPDAGGEP